ncbi:MAG TPA: hypothetical protein VGG27_02220 [Magnetospirillaceae bacterium]|jgi:hypothetical protein
MPIGGEKYEFTQKNVDESPASGGVYCFYADNALIYYGSAPGGASTIRARLKSHFMGVEGGCTEAATHYKREACNNPAEREKELLVEFRERHGRLPRCNARKD